jgi:TolA-binding protein
MSMDAIIVALITGGLSLLGVVITNMMAARRTEQRMITAQAVTDARLEELTREVRAHNNFAQRVPVLEEQLRVANHRIAELEEASKSA